MTEIRYVLRNKHTKKIHYKVYSIESIERGLVSLFDLHNYDIISRDRYSSLTDKNGKKVFEGDLVQHDAWDYPFEVIFSNENARFVCRLKTGLTQYIDSERIEIIGNIHEGGNNG